MRFILRILQLIVVLFAVAFTLLNGEMVFVNFIFKKAEVPVAVVGLMGFGVGMLLSILILLGPLLHQSFQGHILQRKIKKMEEKLTELRNNH